MEFRNFLEGLGEGVRSFIEVVTIAILGFLPLMLLVINNNSDSEGFELFGPLSENLASGQLYLYVFSLYGTLLWLSVFDWRYPHHLFRLGLAFLVIVMGLLLVAVANFDPSFSGKAQPWVVQGSYIAYGLSLILYWLLLLSQNIRPPTIAETTDQDVSRMEEKMKKLQESHNG